ncbi:MAG: ion transporter [Planctomycetota bacterium]|jgi:voltage-gated potassium channel
MTSGATLPTSARERWHEIIFEADTPAGKLFDVILLIAILLSVTAVILESVVSVRETYGTALAGIEWFFTGLFTVEYLLRLWVVRSRLGYVFSFFGIIDFLAVLPTYLALFIVGAQSFLVLRILRLLRIFRVLKLARFLAEANVLSEALRASRHKITVFVGGVLCAVVIMGALMYLIEGPASGFTSIPTAMYWAVVTMTTVGYGDVTPESPLGQVVSAMLMILGYGIIAVPTGIVSAELVKVTPRVSTQVCKDCSREGHDPDASHCKWCGSEL